MNCPVLNFKIKLCYLFKVTTIDFSENAIKNTLKLANEYKLEIEAYQLNALDIKDLGKKFDLVVGKFILHHIEPFDKFSLALFSL